MMQGKTQTIKKVVLIVNVINAILLIVLSTLSLVYVVIGALASFKFFLIFSPVYMILFGVLLLVSECKIKFITKRVPFLKSLIGRALFNIYLSSVIYYYFDAGGQQALAWIGAIILFCSGVFYIILRFGCVGKIDKTTIQDVDDDTPSYKQRLM